MSDFHTVAQVDEIPDGEGRAFAVDGVMVAVFMVDGEYFAINDTCPHMGASLATGYVEDGGVTCPWHAWRFCVQDGTWLDNPNAKVKTDAFPVRVQGNDIQVQLAAPDSSASNSPES